MQSDLDTRRHPDGSIDFDFYRRRATRWRRKTRAALIHRLVTHFVQAVRYCISAMPRPRHRRGAPRRDHIAISWRK